MVLAGSHLECPHIFGMSSLLSGPAAPNSGGLGAGKTGMGAGKIALVMAELGG